ncbi:endonuclease/exonuclease/phosphatase family protein [Neobacillus mesonae]|uniref:Endonuclease/exonuclease/phosphatase n=1 Tax=Neobacillus mesonae TaxID=1193713 RepID=A0A3Q9QVD1_9BACI|nr:endonuclease/exonuclease/phosphatase family protein [Neobacillus mesonae]AZU62304.1 endonuclease/exonuclease/phosphatase [Neobacillus mesonae]
MRKVPIILAVMFLIVSLTSLGSSAFAEEQEFPRGESVGVKVMSYNIHHGVGEDGVLDLGRIAQMIEEANADIIGLQEVDNHWSSRSDFQDQAKKLADRLGMFYTYAANLDLEPINPGEPRRQYGTAILSKYPILKSVNHQLSKIGNTEQRGLLEASINVKGNHFHVYNTHLALTSAERQIQIEEIINIASRSEGPKVILGDLNATPESNEMKLLYSNYQDTFAEENKANTYPAINPTKRIDYIFSSNNLETKVARVINTLASDHLPIMTELVLERNDPFNNGNK